MSEELLRLDGLPRLPALRFLAMDVFRPGIVIGWDELSKACEKHSIGLALLLPNAVKFMQEILLAEKRQDGAISSKIGWSEHRAVTDDASFCAMITKRLIDQLTRSGHLTHLFNPDTVKFDAAKYALAIDSHLIPLEYPLIKTYLLSMGIAYVDSDIRTRLLIHPDHKYLFVEEVLKRAIPGSVILQLSQNIQKPIEIPVQDPPLKKGVTIFISYSHLDEPLKEELLKHFSALRYTGVIKTWHDGIILPGQDWNSEITKNLLDADIILLMISHNFMNSDYINRVEMKEALRLHECGQTRVIPIIARPCDFASLPSINRFQALPRKALPITKWDDQNDAYLDIVQQVKKLLVV